MKTVAIIQARMASKRLPGKILMPIGELPLYKIVYNRVASSECVDQVVFATTDKSIDNIFCNKLDNEKICYFRGSETNVLSRYRGCAEFFQADNIVRITCDDPFKDPKIIDQCLKPLVRGEIDFSSNVIEPSFAEGLDVECFTRSFLEEMDEVSSQAYQREHVTPYFYENKERFNYFSLKDSKDFSGYRLTLDDPIDLEILTDLYRVSGFNYSISYSEIKKLVQTKDFKKRLVGRVKPYKGVNEAKGIGKCNEFPN